MNRRTGSNRIVHFVLCLVLAVGTGFGGSLSFLRAGSGVSSAHAQEAESLEQAGESLRQEANEVSALQEELHAGVEALNAELTQLSEEMGVLSAQMEQTQEQIAKTDEELKQARESAQAQYAAMQLRIRYMYENQDTGMLELILAGETIGEILSRAEYVAALTDYDREMLDSLEKTESEIAAREAELAAAQEALGRQQEEQKTRQEEVMEKIAQYQEKIADCAERILSLNAQADALEEEAQARRDLVLQQSGQTQPASSEEESGRQEKPPAAETGAAQEEPEETDGTQPETGAESGESPAAGGDVELLGAIIWSEAGNQPQEGQLAVANVVLNRVNSEKFPNSVLEVLYQPGQFTPVANGTFAAYLASGVEEEYRVLARRALAGENVVPEALYFRRAAGEIPEDAVVIGDHIFY